MAQALDDLREAATEAQKRAEQALRKAGKARARLETAEKDAEAAGVFEEKGDGDPDETDNG